MNDYKDLGYMNGWEYEVKDGVAHFTKAKEYNFCREQGHQLRSINRGRCDNRYICDICKIYYDVDSSD